MLLQSSPEVLISADTLRSVLTTLSTALLIWMCKMMFTMRDDVRDLKHGWKGEDGTNGARSQLAEHEVRLSLIERRHADIDAVERAQYDGPDRRHESRRLRDKLHEPPPERDS